MPLRPANLVENILVEQQGHLSVGLVGMQWFMQTLTECGQTEAAFQVATRTTRPSWGYMVAKGGTSVWERWDQDTRDPGMNGESQLILAGNLGAWFYQALAGINYDPDRPAFKHIILQPHLAENNSDQKTSQSILQPGGFQDGSVILYWCWRFVLKWMTSLVDVVAIGRRSSRSTTCTFFAGHGLAIAQRFPAREVMRTDPTPVLRRSLAITNAPCAPRFSKPPSKASGTAGNKWIVPV